MIKIIAIVIVVFIAGILGYAATRPDTLRVQRATTIHAAPDKIFAFINDFRSWPSWSPYEKKDPLMKRTLSGAASGKGAIYEWDGDKNIGKGRMEILDTTPGSKIVIKLDFFSPFEGHNTAEFALSPKGNATDLTWLMYGPNTFMGKVMGTFINMDKMIGDDFEVGLANLKVMAEQ